MMPLFERERARARELGAVEMLPAECVAVPGGIEMQPQGPSDRSEMIGIAVPLVILGLVITVLSWSGCTRAAPLRVIEPAPIVVPISPEDALVKAVEDATKETNHALCKSNRSHLFAAAVASQIAPAYRAKGWVVSEARLPTEKNAKMSYVELYFDWPEVKP